MTDSNVYLFAAEANAELAALHREYAALEARYDAALEKSKILEAALNRSLAVLANLEKALENKYAPLPQADWQSAPLRAL